MTSKWQEDLWNIPSCKMWNLEKITLLVIKVNFFNAFILTSLIKQKTKSELYYYASQIHV